MYVPMPLSVTEGTLQSSPLLYDGKKEVRTMRTSVSILSSWWIISGGRQSCARSLPAFTLSSEFSTVQVLARPQNLSALRNNEVSAFRRAVKYYA